MAVDAAIGAALPVDTPANRTAERSTHDALMEANLAAERDLKTVIANLEAARQRYLARWEGLAGPEQADARQGG